MARLAWAFFLFAGGGSAESFDFTLHSEDYLYGGVHGVRVENS
jgi:hypothetical protein